MNIIHLRLIVVSILLGIIITVSIAWSISAFKHFLPINSKGDTFINNPDSLDADIAVIQHEQFGASVYSVYGSSWDREKGTFSWAPFIQIQQELRQMIPDWMSAELNDNRELISGRQFLVSGWPMQCLQCEFVVDSTGDRTTSLMHGGLDLPGSSKVVIEQIVFQRGLPIHPIWLAFIVNSLFYALFIWLIIICVRASRRNFRRGKGLCVVCRYDLRGSIGDVCPECGWNCENGD